MPQDKPVLKPDEFTIDPRHLYNDPTILQKRDATKSLRDAQTKTAFGRVMSDTGHALPAVLGTGGAWLGTGMDVGSRGASRGKWRSIGAAAGTGLGVFGDQLLSGKDIDPEEIAKQSAAAGAIEYVVPPVVEKGLEWLPLIPKGVKKVIGSLFGAAGPEVERDMIRGGETITAEELAKLKARIANLEGKAASTAARTAEAQRGPGDYAAGQAGGRPPLPTEKQIPQKAATPNPRPGVNEREFPTKAPGTKTEPVVEQPIVTAPPKVESQYTREFVGPEEAMTAERGNLIEGVPTGKVNPIKQNVMKKAMRTPTTPPNAAGQREVIGPVQSPGSRTIEGAPDLPQIEAGSVPLQTQGPQGLAAPSQEVVRSPGGDLEPSYDVDMTGGRGTGWTGTGQIPSFGGVGSQRGPTQGQPGELPNASGLGDVPATTNQGSQVSSGLGFPRGQNQSRPGQGYQTSGGTAYPPPPPTYDVNIKGLVDYLKKINVRDLWNPGTITRVLGQGFQAHQEGQIDKYGAENKGLYSNF